jgi:ubiquinol-cytochrome c reductase subunit 7
MTAFIAFDEPSRYSPNIGYAKPRAGTYLLQASLSHRLLPKEEHTKPEEVPYSSHRVIRNARQTNNALQDIPYLSPIIAEIEAEGKERFDLESLAVKKK